MKLSRRGLFASAGSVIAATAIARPCDHAMVNVGTVSREADYHVCRKCGLERVYVISTWRGDERPEGWLTPIEYASAYGPLPTPQRLQRAIQAHI